MMPRAFDRKRPPDCNSQALMLARTHLPYKKVCLTLSWELLSRLRTRLAGRCVRSRAEAKLHRGNDRDLILSLGQHPFCHTYTVSLLRVFVYDLHSPPRPPGPTASYSLQVCARRAKQTMHAPHGDLINGQRARGTQTSAPFGSLPDPTWAISRSQSLTTSNQASDSECPGERYVQLDAFVDISPLRHRSTSYIHLARCWLIVRLPIASL